MNRSRRLLVSAEHCLGCRACATVCPAGLITRTDADFWRTLRFAAVCAEECDRCAAACPTQAITLADFRSLANFGSLGEGTVLEFALVACEGCGAPLAPAEMLAHLRATVPAPVQADAEGLDWLALCPACRQRVEAQRMGREVLLSRWLG